MKLLIKSRREAILLVGALFAHLVLLTAQSLRAPSTPFIRSWALDVAAPFIRRIAGGLSVIPRVWHGYVDLHNVQEENRELRNQVAEYRQALILSEEKIKALDQLKLLSTLDAELKTPAIKAKVIGWDANHWYSSRIIDKGTSSGLSKDSAVISPEGVVGRVIYPSHGSSVVQLITDLDSGVGVLLENSRTQGVMKGGGGREPAIDFISSSEKVTIGEKVLTSGLDQIYPKGLLVGYVSSVSLSKQVFQRIGVSVAANLQKLEYVLVLKKEQPD
jgi:rod shape-determining protein MreC